MIELDQELITSLECPNCHTVENVLRPLSEVSFEAGHCPTCGVLRESTLTHIVSGEENFLHRTLASVGIPALHIVRAHNGVQYRFYELTGDLPEALHFRHFEQTRITVSPQSQNHVRIKEELEYPSSGSVVKIKNPSVSSAHGHVKLRG